MVDNVDRFKRAEEALEIFVDRIMHGEMNEQGALDLICDIGHFCRLRLGMSRNETIALYATAIGCWSKQDQAPDGESFTKDSANVTM